ncbi:hypothetical protein KSZ02_08460 [Bacteroides thetaiotaomicron]|uniref:hypothetical protein n=1 Tax=Bacteroides thetaiotaomicron TaxID=818 RepID=UPI001C37B816|nr:hypothetical protein [Bacteroides thetaiotaomicron]MBV4088413.1 hypothetical protein [Bacteroides thetaiotaomicron]MBV4100249.1 hypothetical protein [Bacteroides thetaiotaomicron]MBV4135978.1 hypothetical protein [Bacteroides thetaiotaomicron]MCS2964156.1 hypothetical protein [Bacteroides thetaiotaomicron]UVV52775.1 hypothetical protein NXY15_25215 [Bacteroides thetaiotaomicron]
MVKITNRVKTLLLLLGVIALGLFLFLLPQIIGFDEKVLLIALGIYAIIFIILNVLCSKTKNRFILLFIKIINFPIPIIYVIFKIALPTVALLFNTIMFFMVTWGIPALILYGLNALFSTNLSEATMNFITLSLASIMSVHASKYVLKAINRFSPITMDTYQEKPERKYIKELTTFIYQGDNVNFFIYLGYFIYLSITAFLTIQYNTYLINANTDFAVLKSFLVFLAFTNMMKQSQNTKFAPESILTIYAKIIFGEESSKKS